MPQGTWEILMGWSKTYGMLSFIHVVVQGHTEKPRVHIITLTTYKVGPTGTLSIIHSASIVVGSSKITSTASAAGHIIAQAPIFRQALVAVLPSYKTLAIAVAADLVTGAAIYGDPTRVTSAGLAAKRIVEAQSIKGFLAAVTTPAFDVLFAATLPCNHAQHCICVAITHTSIQRAHWVTITGDACHFGPDVSQWVAVEERLADLAVAAHGVVLALITDATTGVACGQVHSHVKVAPVGVFVAVALFASMWIVDLSWTPRQVLIEILAELTVETLGVVLADTSSVDHALNRVC